MKIKATTLISIKL